MHNIASRDSDVIYFQAKRFRLQNFEEHIWQICTKNYNQWIKHICKTSFRALGPFLEANLRGQISILCAQYSSTEAQNLYRLKILIICGHIGEFALLINKKMHLKKYFSEPVS